jgi:hypothetical protein
MAALLHELTKEASTFDRRDALPAWVGVHPQRDTVADAEAFADELLSTSAVVRVDEAGGPAGEPRYTTPELLAVEREMLATATGAAGLGSLRPIPPTSLRRSGSVRRSAPIRRSSCGG